MQEEKTKVLHVVSSMNVGGVQTLLMSVYRSLYEVVQFDFSCMKKENYYENEIRELGGEVTYVYNHKKIMKHIKALRGAVKAQHYSAVHIHSNNAVCVVEAIIARSCGTKNVIIHSHNTSGGSGLIHKLLKPLIPLFADKMVACSEEAAVYMYPRRVIRQKNYVVIHNGIQTERFAYDSEVRADYRKRMGLTDKFVIGTIGRFYDQKNPYGILAILERIVAKNKNVLLLWVGNGPMFDEIQTEIKKRELTEYICLTGVRDDTAALLQAMDIFIFPSKYEGLGIAVIEAQTAGLECLCSKNVPQEAAVTDLCHFLSLKDYDVWGAAIGRYGSTSGPRRSYVQEVTAAGYDMRSTVSMFRKMYTSM